MRQQLFKHVLTLDPAHFVTLKTGDALARMTTDMTLVEGVVSNIIPVALRNLIILVGRHRLDDLAEPESHRLRAAADPGPAHPLFLLTRRMQRLSVRAQDFFAEAVAYAGENLSALETVQAFGQEGPVSARFDGAVERAFEASRASLRARGLLSALMITIIFFGMLALLYQAALAVIVQHSLSAGALSQLLLLAFFAANAVKDLSELWGQVQKASGAAERIAEMMDLRPAIGAPERAIPMPKPAARRDRLRGRQLRLSAPDRTPGAGRLHAACSAGGARRPGRPFRRGQEHGAQAPAAVLRSGRGRDPHRRRRSRRRPIRRRCASASRSSPRTRRCSPARRRRTSASAARPPRWRR